MPSARTVLWRSLVVCFVVACAALPLPYARAQTADLSSLQTTFTDAAREFGVPERMLLALSYNLSRWDDHAGQPSTVGGFGPMHLIDANLVLAADRKGEGRTRSTRAADLLAQQPTIGEAATLLGVSPDRLKRDVEQNVRGGAALLAQYARRSDGTLPTAEGDWYGAVARYHGDPAAAQAQLFADDVYATISSGVTRTTINGQQVALAASAMVPNRATAPAAVTPQAVTTAECPPELACRVAPAAYEQNDPEDPEDYGNYDIANRERDGLEIRYIVIHDTETPYDATIRSFQNPERYASSHYVLKSSNGEITQMVENRDVAWTAGNWYINAHSINFEHEGYALYGASWYTESMYRSSARLTRFLADRYGIPLDRHHILGHDEVPGVTPKSQTGMHWDPGPFWDWQHYMELAGAPLTARSDGSNNIVMINPDFDTNRQSFSNASTQPANMVHVYTAPDANAPLIDDPALAGAGTKNTWDWGDKAVTGRQFYRFERRGDWDGIYYGGQRAWYYNPNEWRTVAGSGMLITPKPGRGAIPVYGAAYPETSAYPPERSPSSFEPLQYTIPFGQVYVAHERVAGTHYSAPEFTMDRSKNLLVRGQQVYYVISFNHRTAFLRAEDVQMIGASGQPLPYIRYLPTIGGAR